ncbi:MAG: hypothetical protein NEHIOOID_01138 [Holosporales bacterium]
MIKVIITGMMACQLLNGMCRHTADTQAHPEMQQEMRTIEEQIRSELYYYESSTILEITEKNLNNAQFLSLLKGFGNLSDSDKKIMVDTLLKIPQDRHTAFVDFIKPFILKENYNKYIFETGASIDPKDYAHYHKMILPLYDIRFFDSSQKKFHATTLLETPIEKLTENFIAFAMPFLLKNINIYRISEILRTIDPKDYAHYHKMILPLYEMYFFDSWRKSEGVEKLLKMPVERLTENFMAFINDITPLFSRRNMLEAIDLAYHYPQEVYPQLKESCKKLAVGIPLEKYDSIFNALIQIPIQEHPIFITVVDKFYNAIKKDKHNLIWKFSANALDSTPYRYMRYLNVPQYKIDLFKKFSKLIQADHAINCLEMIPEQNLTPAFYKMIKRLTKGLEKYDIFNFITKLKDINLDKIKEEHYIFFENSRFLHKTTNSRILNIFLKIRYFFVQYQYLKPRNADTFKYIINLEKKPVNGKI